MKIAPFLVAGFLLACAQAWPAHAQSIEEKQLAAGKFSFDPEAGYIYVHGPFRQTGTLLKVPDQADMDAYKKDWDEAFANAKAEYVKRLASWESERKAAAGSPHKTSGQPVEPTPETFTIGDIETRTKTSFGPDYAFIKDNSNNYYSYFMKVKPGTYVYYGPFMTDPNGAHVGACYCMGSIQFEVKPGVITDTGNFLLTAQFQTPANPPRVGVVFTPEETFVMIGKLKIDLRTIAWGLPASLNGFPSTRADFRASGKIDNFYGVSVLRMPAIPGILAYQRDKVIDLKLLTGR